MIFEMQDEIDMIERQIRATIWGAVIGAIFVAFVVWCIQHGHAPIF